MSGFFPIMMFGLPGAALAMYLAAPKARRPMVGGMLLSVAITAFLTGVTEPLEFLFMFRSAAVPPACGADRYQPVHRNGARDPCGLLFFRRCN